MEGWKQLNNATSQCTDDEDYQLGLFLCTCSCLQQCSNNQVFVVTRLARLGLCRQSCLGFSSITLISSNRNDKLRSYSWDPSTLAVSTNPCQRGGDLMTFLQRREDTCSYYYNKEFLRTVDPIIQNFQTKSKANKLQKFETELLKLSIRNYMET